MGRNMIELLGRVNYWTMKVKGHSRVSENAPSKEMMSNNLPQLIVN